MKNEENKLNEMLDKIPLDETTQKVTQDEATQELIKERIGLNRTLENRIEESLREIIEDMEIESIRYYNAINPIRASMNKREEIEKKKMEECAEELRKWSKERVEKFIEEVKEELDKQWIEWWKRVEMEMKKKGWGRQV